nr:hypothetical protein [Tanacetum cinerariifolium]
TTYSSSPNQLLEKFTDELALITFPPEYDDDLQFDIESDLKEIEYLLHHDPIKDIDSIKSDTENIYDDPFDSKGEKIKESKLLIYELDLPCDFLLPSEYDSCVSEDFSRVDALPSTNNEDKFWNTVTIKQNNDVTRMQALVDKKKVVVTEAAIRDVLQLDDAEGVDCLPNEEIFVELACMVTRSHPQSSHFIKPSS